MTDPQPTDTTTTPLDEKPKKPSKSRAKPPAKARVRTVRRTRVTLTRDERRRRTAWMVTAVLAVAAIVAAVILAQQDDEPVVVDASELVTDRPVGVSEQTLREFAAIHDGPVYWAGPRADTVYELTVTEPGDVFIRYLPLGVAPGNQQPDFLTVATYTRPDAYQALQEVALGDRFVSEETASGALVVYAADSPTSAHFSFPDTDIQVEVYDPQPNRAVSLVLDGSITLLP